MGTKYRFVCPACSYHADVSGGVDVGEAVRTVTISCATCKELDDVVVSKEPWKEPPDPIPPQPRCARSRTRRHVTSLWTAPGPCPKCQATMEEGDVVIMWD